MNCNNIIDLVKYTISLGIFCLNTKNEVGLGVKPQIFF